MGFQVDGSRDGRPYTVTVDVTLTGDADVIAWLRNAVGTTFVVPATGPAYRLRLDDPRAILAALMAATRVECVSGEYPQVVPPDKEADVVY